jgi:hypothetical protein
MLCFCKSILSTGKGFYCIRMSSKSNRYKLSYVIVIFNNVYKFLSLYITSYIIFVCLYSPVLQKHTHSQIFTECRLFFKIFYYHYNVNSLSNIVSSFFIFSTKSYLILSKRASISSSRSITF